MPQGGFWRVCGGAPGVFALLGVDLCLTLERACSLAGHWDQNAEASASTSASACPNHVPNGDGVGWTGVGLGGLGLAGLGRAGVGWDGARWGGLGWAGAGWGGLGRAGVGWGELEWVVVG